MNGRGYAFVNQSCLLASFCRGEEDPDLRDIGASAVIKYLNARQITSATWRNNYATFVRFFDFWRFRDEMPALVMPAAKPRGAQSFFPYIYSKAEIRRLLKAVDASQSDGNCTIAPDTLKALLLTLYGTGARLGEVLTLRVGDLDHRAAVLHLRALGRTVPRRLPLNHDLLDALIQHSEHRELTQSSSDLLFVNREGRRIPETTLRHTYGRLCKIAGVSRRYGKEFRPRLNDLRPTFAVHRITWWIDTRQDLNRMLPALAAYMGHAGLGTTEQYLQKAPERFRKQLRLLCPKDSKPHWREDSGLMRFLRTL